MDTRAGSFHETSQPPAVPAQKNQQRAGISPMILPVFAVLWSVICLQGNPANS